MHGLTVLAESCIVGCMTRQALAAEAVQRMIADEVRAEMARERKTASELAQVLGVTQHTIGRRINGASPFNVYELAQVAECLGTTTDALVAAALAHAEKKKAVA